MICVIVLRERELEIMVGDVKRRYIYVDSNVRETFSRTLAVYGRGVADDGAYFPRW